MTSLIPSFLWESSLKEILILMAMLWLAARQFGLCQGYCYFNCDETIFESWHTYYSSLSCRNFLILALFKQHHDMFQISVINPLVFFSRAFLVLLENLASKEDM